MARESVAISEGEAQNARARLRSCVDAVSSIYLGNAEVVDALFIGLLARGHVLLEGVPGIAKTTLARAVAQVLGCPLSRLQFTPDLLPADILGGAIFHAPSQRFVLHRGPIFTHILLGDEINRAPAKTQAALLEAMQEHQVSLEGESHALPEPFFVLATQNPIEQVGVYPLPEAQLDRFLLRISMDYPEWPAQELAMLQTHGTPPPTLSAQLNAEQIIGLQALSDRIYAHDAVLEYIVMLSRESRSLPQLLVGASPRAGLALLRASRARALLRGRSFVSPDDVQALLPVVFSHRLIPQPELSFEGWTPEESIQQLLELVSYRGPELPRAGG